MQAPQRGEVWYCRLFGAFEGEIGSKYDAKGDAAPIRRCVVVSHDFFNHKFNRLTVVPITSRAGRQGTMEQWSTVIKVSDYRSWLDHDSVVDCGQPWTITVLEPRHNPRNDLYGYCGELNEEDMTNVDRMLLRVFTGNGIRRTREKPPFLQRQVIMANFLNVARELVRKPCVVVSSPKIDAVRQWKTREGLLVKHCTIIALTPTQYFDSCIHPHAVEIVDISRHDTGVSECMLAHCQEILTINHHSISRDMFEFGQVINQEQMDSVYDKLLYKYLFLLPEENIGC